MNFKRLQIKRVFTDLKELKVNGIWYGGNKVNSEYKSWWSNGNLAVAGVYKYGKLDGIYKEWDWDGILDIHQLHKNGKLIKDFMK